MTLASQVATPGTLLNPFTLYPVMSAGLDTLVVDKDMNPYLLAKMFFAMKDVSGGDGKSPNMPVSGSIGGNLQWDRPKVKQLVNELKSGGQQVPNHARRGPIPDVCMRDEAGAGGGSRGE